MSIIELRPTPRSKLSKNKLNELDKKQNEFEQRVERAIKYGKIFKNVGGWNVPRIKYELSKRNWIEIIDNPFKNMYTRLSDALLLEKAENNNEYEQALLSKMIGIRRPRCLWTEQPHFYYLYESAQMMNKIHVDGMDFWLKDGLCRWIKKANKRTRKRSEPINFPRSYDLCESQQIIEFQNDYRFTIATNLIRFLNTCDNILDYVSDTSGSISHTVLDYAFRIICDHIHHRESCRSDTLEKDYYKNEKEIFAELNKAYSDVMYNGAKIFITTEDKSLEDYIADIMMFSDLVDYYFPWRKYDGYKNVWLVKPNSSGEGQGIKLFNNIHEILDHADSNPEKYIVQKYIERPFLIYSTKFDLRQYFLVSVDEEYFYVWSHPLCSVKLASEEFNLDNFNESIHLTNAAIQQKYFYKNSHPDLPHHHMWNLGTLILYMQKFDQGHKWDECIYPEIKRILTKISHSIAYHAELTNGRFELFGCDWIITEDFQPYLLEINRHPCLGIYSPVSVTVCGTICEDLVRVIVDYHEDKEANTGGFEIIYKAKIEEIKGQSLRRNSIIPKKAQKMY